MPASHDHRLAMFAAFCIGQLQGLHSDHRAVREYAGVLQTLPQNEIRRGRRAAESWLADLRARYQGLPPECVSGTGSAALTAQLLGDL